MASIITRARWDGTTAVSVRWRDYRSGHQRRLTVRSEQEALDLVRYLNDNEQMPESNEPAGLLGKQGGPTVAEVVQEHIDLLVRPSPGTIGTYQRMLDLRIRNTIGQIPVDEFGYRDVMRWVKGLSVDGVAPKSIKNMHGLLSAAMKTAELLGYISRNPSKPPTARINKAWKRDGQSRYYLGPTKTRAGKRSVGLNPALVDLLIPLVASRPGSEPLFTTPDGQRIAHKPFWQHNWVPAVHAARAQGLTKSPRIHDLRHTHASWLIQDGGISLFALSRRLGHASVRTTEQVYGHLMPQALQDGADATERSVRGLML